MCGGFLPPLKFRRAFFEEGGYSFFALFAQYQAGLDGFLAAERRFEELRFVDEFFILASASGGMAARRAASSAVFSRSSASSATSVVRPSFSASSAVSFSGSIMRRFASRGPARRGSRKLPPQSAIRPMELKACVNFAFFEAQRKSQASVC
mgnify:CR=1 FL=1